MKQAVITGATGMIASALIRRLARDHCRVFAVVRPGSAKMGNLPVQPEVRPVPCDLSELRTLPQRIPGGCDAFYHFGWGSTYGNSRNDACAQERNIAWTLDAVAAAHELGCGVFVGAGSQAEYGRTDGDLKPETPVNPETGYGIAKYGAGKLSALLCHRLGMRHVWARILSVYGPGDNSYTMMMSCIRSFCEGKPMAFTPGEQIWDYLYCDDAAEAFRLMGERGHDGAVYPLGSGRPRPLREYIRTVRDLVAPALPDGIGERPYPAGQVMRLCADISSLAKDTGFEPAVDFAQGVRRTAEWLRTGNTGDPS